MTAFDWQADARLGRRTTAGSASGMRRVPWLGTRDSVSRWLAPTGYAAPK